LPTGDRTGQVTVPQSVIDALRGSSKERGRYTGLLVGEVTLRDPQVATAHAAASLLVATVREAIPLVEGSGETGWSKASVETAMGFVRARHSGLAAIGWYRVRRGEAALGDPELQVARMFPSVPHLVLVCDREGSEPMVFEYRGESEPPRLVECEVVAALEAGKAPAPSSAPLAPDRRQELDDAVAQLQPDRLEAPPPLNGLPAGRAVVELPCDATRPRGKLATAVVFDHGALRAQAERVSRQGLGDVGLLVGRFGALKGRPFCLVEELRPLPAPEGPGPVEAASWWLDDPVRLAAYAARLSALLVAEGRSIVGWYYDAPAAEAMPSERHRALRQAVFAHPRFVTVALFGASAARPRGVVDTRESSRFFPHRVYVAEVHDAEPHGLAQVTSVAALTS